MTFLRRITAVFIPALGIFSISISRVFAQGIVTGASNPTVTGATNPGVSSGLLNPLNATSLQQLLQEILTQAVIPIGSIFLTIMLIYVGYLFVVAQGAPEKVSQARTALLWTVVGGLLLLGASALATVITTTASSL